MTSSYTMYTYTCCTQLHTGHGPWAVRVRSVLAIPVCTVLVLRGRSSGDLRHSGVTRATEFQSRLLLLLLRCCRLQLHQRSTTHAGPINCTIRLISSLINPGLMRQLNCRPEYMYSAHGLFQAATCLLSLHIFPSSRSNCLYMCSLYHRHRHHPLSDQAKNT